MDLVARRGIRTKVANELLVFPRNNSRIHYRDGNTRFLLPAAFH